MADILEGLKKLEKNFTLRLEIEDLARTWHELYPHLNIREQLILANNWCVGNPKKAPKYNLVRFLNTWMKLANEWSQKIGKPIQYKEDKPAEDEVLTGDDFKRMREALRK